MRLMNDFYESVFPLEELQQARNNLVFFRNCVILTFCNNLVAKFNKSLLAKLPEGIHTYNFVDNVDINKNGTDHITQEFLGSQTPSELPPSRLNLKVGASIILLCNLYLVSEEYNGTWMVITQLGRHCIETLILGGKFNGQLCLVP